MTIKKDIEKTSKSKRVLFTTPSHDRDSFIVPDCNALLGEKFFKNDLSEINGLDNLSSPENSILQSMKKSAEKIGADKVFYLVNGSSSGIISAMMTVLKDKDKVLIARNCHKSVVNGLILTGAEPVWILPDMNNDWGVFDAVSPKKIEEAILNNRDIRAIIITSPTYEGISSDIKTIADICHKYNKLLIVDEAHGALKSFAPDIFGENAVKLGADIAVESLHKTCGAPNPCAIMLCGKNVDFSEMQNSLNLINTTSPSFPIIASVEAVINYLFSKKGQAKISKLVSDINDFKLLFKDRKNVKIFDKNDPAKLLIKVDGLSGFELSDILFEKYNIEDELTNDMASMLLTGIGTTKNKLSVLTKALDKIAGEKNSLKSNEKKSSPVIPKMKKTPRNAFFAEKNSLNIEDAEGKICGEIITEYPPGIPILIPGEQICNEQINYFKNKRKTLKCLK